MIIEELATLIVKGNNPSVCILEKYEGKIFKMGYFNTMMLAGKMLKMIMNSKNTLQSWSWEDGSLVKMFVPQI